MTPIWELDVLFLDPGFSIVRHAPTLRAAVKHLQSRSPKAVPLFARIFSEAPAPSTARTLALGGLYDSAGALLRVCARGKDVEMPEWAAVRKTLTRARAEARQSTIDRVLVLTLLGKLANQRAVYGQAKELLSARVAPPRARARLIESGRRICG